MGATAPADAGYVSITVSLEYRSVASQDELKQLSASRLAGIDEQNRKDVEAGSSYNGLKVLSWGGTSVERVGSATAMVKRYTYQLAGEEPRHMENCEFFLGDRLISLVLQHGEQTLIPTKPIFERVKASVAIK